MKELTVSGDKRMTIREVAGATGIAYSTVAKYASKAGWTANGKTTYLTKAQVTVLLEAMKQPVASGRLANVLFQREGLETDLSDEMQLAMKYKEIASLERKFKEKAIARAEQAEVRAGVVEAERDYEREEHNGTKNESWIELAQLLNQIGWGIEKLQYHLSPGNKSKVELLLEALPPEKTKTMKTCKENYSEIVVVSAPPHCQCCCNCKGGTSNYGGGG